MDIVTIQELKQKEDITMNIEEYILVGSGCEKKIFGEL